MMARKPIEDLMAQTAPPGFNGAAPMMARKHNTADNTADNTAELQWSRANDGAETDLCFVAAGADGRASMEPRQ